MCYGEKRNSHCLQKRSQSGVSTSPRCSQEMLRSVAHILTNSTLMPEELAGEDGRKVLKNHPKRSHICKRVIPRENSINETHEHEQSKNHYTIKDKC